MTLPTFIRVRSFTAIVHGGRAEVTFVPESPPAEEPSVHDRRSVTLVLGDDVELHDVGRTGCMANAVAVACDRVRGKVRVFTSIVGLPPVFIRRLPDRVVVASDLSLLVKSSTPLSLDPAGVLDLFEVGYPLSQRTLYQGVSLLPGGHVLEIDEHGAVSLVEAWSLPASEPRLDWPSYLALQAHAFQSDLGKLDLSSSFFALTGGLDTRAILAALVRENRSLNAATLTGPVPSLDARLASALSKAYSLPHQVVALGSDFLRDIPAYVADASRLSGGLMSVEKAGEIYFYRQLTGGVHRELSGELGNQVGRQGFEGLSARNADVAILADGLLATRRANAPAQRFALTAETWHAVCQRLIQEEATLPQVGTVCLGQHFATQQRPYATRAMIESLGRSPVGLDGVDSFAPSRARWRDLRHRFLGEPTDRSFQRRLIADVGGYVASCPINWGWRAGGGISLAGFAMGVLSLADVVASSSRPGARVLHHGLQMSGMRGLHETKAYGDWLAAPLKDFVHDTLLAQRTRQSGVFNPGQLDRLLQEHYQLGRRNDGTIIAALDLALAQHHFCTMEGTGS